MNGVNEGGPAYVKFDVGEGDKRNFVKDSKGDKIYLELYMGDDRNWYFAEAKDIPERWVEIAIQYDARDIEHNKGEIDGFVRFRADIPLSINSEGQLHEYYRGEMLASLNDPSVGHIHGLGDKVTMGGVDYIIDKFETFYEYPNFTWTPDVAYVLRYRAHYEAEPDAPTTAIEVIIEILGADDMRFPYDVDEENVSSPAVRSIYYANELLEFWQSYEEYLGLVNLQCKEPIYSDQFINGRYVFVYTAELAEKDPVVVDVSIAASLNGRSFTIPSAELNKADFIRVFVPQAEGAENLSVIIQEYPYPFDIRDDVAKGQAFIAAYGVAVADMDNEGWYFIQPEVTFKADTTYAFLASVRDVEDALPLTTVYYLAY
jgi:hypothetical protein